VVDAPPDSLEHVYQVPPQQRFSANHNDPNARIHGSGLLGETYPLTRGQDPGMRLFNRRPTVVVAVWTTQVAASSYIETDTAQPLDVGPFAIAEEPVLKEGT